MELLWLLFIMYAVYKLLTKAQQRQFPPGPVGTGRPRFPGQRLPRDNEDDENSEEDAPLPGPWAPRKDTPSRGTQIEDAPLPGPWSTPRDAGGDGSLPGPLNEQEDVPVSLPGEPGGRELPPGRRERTGRRMYRDRDTRECPVPAGAVRERPERQEGDGYPAAPPVPERPPGRAANGPMRQAGILCAGMFQRNNLINAIILSEVLGNRGGKSRHAARPGRLK